MGIPAHIARLRAVVGHDLLLLPDDELTDVAWFAPADLPGLKLSPFARALLTATGYL